MIGYLVVFHAAALAGATVTTINPTYTAPEVAHQLKDSGATLMFTIPAFLPVAAAAAEGTAVREIVTLGEAAGHRQVDDLLGPPLAAQVPVDLEHPCAGTALFLGHHRAPEGRHAQPYEHGGERRPGVAAS
jgi:acyl-CoA synthetase (AMP-forming)/AMP-acid ligase II